MVSKCVHCSEPYGDHFLSKHFCTALCKILYKEGIGKMVDRLDKDENLIYVLDHVQQLLKEETQGDEEN